MQKEKIELIVSIVATTVFVLLLMIAAIFLFRIYLKRKNRLILEKERMSVEFEQTLLRSRVEIQEQTFTYISREIHDNIGQVLSLVRINLNTLHQEREPEKMVLMDDLLGKAISDLRNLSHSLDTDLIRNTGWIKAAERLLLDIQKTGSYTTSFQAEENLPTLGSEKPIILFRMIQEVTNNIIKHAAATEIIFRAYRRDNKIIIDIADNGKGFDTSSAATGAGLQNLSSRSQLIDASIRVDSELGKGTSVEIAVNTTSHDYQENPDRPR